jgi:hypothetical protein
MKRSIDRRALTSLHYALSRIRGGFNKHEREHKHEFRLPSPQKSLQNTLYSPFVTSGHDERIWNGREKGVVLLLPAKGKHHRRTKMSFLLQAGGCPLFPSQSVNIWIQASRQANKQANYRSIKRRNGLALWEKEKSKREK